MPSSSVIRGEFDELRDRFRDRFVEDNVPKITKSAELATLMQLTAIHVHAGDTPADVAIVFEIICSFDTNGLSAAWVDGRLTRWGGWRDAKA